MFSFRDFVLAARGDRVRDDAEDVRPALPLDVAEVGDEIEDREVASGRIRGGRADAIGEKSDERDGYHKPAIERIGPRL